MRTLKFFALVSTIFSLSFFSASQEATGFHQTGLQQSSNYVVIGAFAVHDNALRFAEYARRNQYEANYELNTSRNLYYVYVMITDDHQAALDEAMRLRRETEFKDAWVYGGDLGERAPGDDINPVTEQPIDVTTDTASPAMPESESEPEPEPVVVEEATPDTDVETSGKRFVFDLFRAVDREPVQGDVNVIDADRSRKMATFKGNETVSVMSPQNNSGKISLICEVFGYRKVQHDLNYNDPESDNIDRDENGNIIVPFELTRLQKGDIAVMYNVYFYKDAAVMRPESRYEVNSLLDMLNENPNYKIRLHGHTNGSAPGKIISMGESQNFFSLTDTKEGFGSAKKLSDERAAVIRDFLVSEGIDTKRIEIKSWGGKRPIHDKNSNRAHENVRVEVEILED